jgi:hypothetical protein
MARDRSPVDVLRKIAGLAKAIDALLQANLVAHAWPLASELRAIIEAARGLRGVVLTA